MSKEQVLLDGELLKEWEQAHTSNSAEKLAPLAGLFHGWMPKGFNTEKHRILYVGKQTSGEFNRSDEERLSFNKGSSGFWKFARQIASKVSCSTQTLDCIAWSNISKIAFFQIKADKSLLDNLNDLPIRSLEAEITITDPHLILFVTKDFSDSTVHHIAGTSTNNHWNKSENESRDKILEDVWWRKRTDGRFVVWMRHPNFAKPELLEYASSKIADLLSSPR